MKRSTLYLLLFFLLLPINYGQAQEKLILGKVIFRPVPISVSYPVETEDDNEGEKSTSNYIATELFPSLSPSIQSSHPSGSPVNTNPPSNDLSQLEVPQALNNEAQLSEFTSLINDQERSGGAYNPQLSESLLSLGNYHRNIGEYDEALEAYDRAFHINRINQGLFNSQQINIINEITNTHLAHGDFVEAHLQQEYLYYLKTKIGKDNIPYKLQAAVDHAEWNYSLVQMGYNFTLTDDYEFFLKRLIDANIYYSHALTNLDLLSPENSLNVQLETRRASTNYHLARFMSLLSNTVLSARNTAYTFLLSPDFVSSPYYFELGRAGYADGKEALENRLATLQSDENADIEQLARFTVDLADWHMVFQRRDSASKYYQEALQILESSSLEEKEALINELFIPDQPVRIPTFVASVAGQEGNGLDPATIEFQGYIDVSYEINRYGLARRINILGTSSKDAESLTNTLRRELASSASTFRPKFADGELTPMQQVTQRFYYSYIAH